MKRSLLLVALALGLSSCRGIVDTVYPVHAEPASVKAGAYRIDTSHASVIFHVRHMDLARFYGRMPVTGGTLVIDPTAPESATVQVSLSAAGIDTANETIDRRLLDLLDAEKHPDISFHSAKVTRTGETTADVIGNLTIAGVTKPATLQVSFRGKRTDPLSGKARLGFDAATTVSIRDYGLSASWTAFVSDEIGIEIGAEFVRED